MRLGVVALSLAILLAALAGQNSLLRSTNAENNGSSAITACATAGADAVQGGCLAASLDSTPRFTLTHTVLKDACHSADLHLVRYLPAGYAAPLVAAYCR